jgi:hypothetical protein
MAVNAPVGVSRRLRLGSPVVAGFQVSIGGRIRVSTEGLVHDFEKLAYAGDAA